MNAAIQVGLMMEKDELKEILDNFKSQVMTELRHSEAMNSSKFTHIDTRFDSQNMVMAKLGDTLSSASQKNLEALVSSQKLMSEATATMLGKNEQSLQRLHNRIDSIDTKLVEGSRLFAEFGQRIAHLERIVYSGGGLLGAGIAGLAFKVLGGG